MCFRISVLFVKPSGEISGWVITFLILNDQKGITGFKMILSNSQGIHLRVYLYALNTRT